MNVMHYINIHSDKKSNRAIAKFLHVSPSTVQKWRDENPNFDHMIEHASETIANELAVSAFTNATKTRKKRSVVKHKKLDPETGKMVVFQETATSEDVLPTAKDVNQAQYMGMLANDQRAADALKRWKDGEIDDMQLEIQFQAIGWKVPHALRRKIEQQKEVNDNRLRGEQVKRINEYHRMLTNGIITDEQYKAIIDQELGNNGT